MANPKNNFNDLEAVGSIKGVSDLLGVDRHLVTNGIRLGHISTRKLGDGQTKVVVIESARAWVESDRKRGPRPGGERNTGERVQK